MTSDHPGHASRSSRATTTARSYRFQRSLRLPGASAAQLGRFHLDTDNFRHLVMPTTRVVRTPSPDVRPGSTFTVEMRELGFWPIHWPGIWRVVDPNHRLVDELERPTFPFARWRHEHRFEDTAGGALLTDQVWFAPMMPRALRVASPLVAFGIRLYLSLMFAWRHRITARRLAATARH